MSRRNSKSARELIADLTDRTKLFCDSYYDPKTSDYNENPLIHITQFTDCKIAYIHYLLEGDKNE